LNPAAIFEPLAGVPGVNAAFIPRIAGIDVVTDRATALERLASSHGEYLRQRGFDIAQVATAEQVHGDIVAVAEKPSDHAGADALVTRVRGLTLGIYVADCAAVYLADRKGRAVGLVHSGRAGTGKNIVGRTIDVLRDEFGVEPADLVAQISPCIRPPLYETDFAAEVAAQAREAGVLDARDCAICTGRHVDRYYSYRVERGLTGRMLAALALQP
jgi:copper oxidase (laccase) domain-containing protein